MTSHVTPPPRLLRGGGVVLRRTSVEDAAAIAESLATSLEHLRGWMAWAANAAVTEAEQRDRLAAVDEDWEAGREYRYVVLPGRGEKVLLGLASLHRRVGPRAIEVGYWVDVRHLRRGHATAAARVLTDAALALPDVERVEIHCDERNVASARVAARLGYRLDRVVDKPPFAPLESGRSMVWVTP